MGELKKEVAYHRDVSKTITRIQGQCNEVKSRLLITEEIQNQLDETSGNKSELIGKIKLKGKSVAIYTIKS